MYSAPISHHPSALKRSSRACDACRRRKVRCNGAERCQQCAHLDIKCMYTAVPSKRSRKAAAPRGTIIDACRSDTRQPSIHSITSPTRFSDVSSPGSGISPQPSRPSFSAGPVGPDFFLALLPEYATAVYPVNPIITEAEIRTCISRMYTDEEALCFLYVYAAVTIALSHVDRGIDAHDQVLSLLASCLERRKPLTHLNMPPSILRVMGSIFLEICYMNLHKTDIALYYLNDAIMQLPMLGLNDYEGMSMLPFAERCRRERLYWECFIHERFASLGHDRNIVLDGLPELPPFDPTIEPWIHSGWIFTIQTFCMIDRDFVDFWLRHREPDPEWIKQRHRDLEDSQWRIDISVLPQMQQADIIVTRQWLRTCLWQIAIRSMLLTGPPSPTSSSSSSSLPDPTRATTTTTTTTTTSSSSSSSSLSLTLPLTLSRELKTHLAPLTTHSVGVHGSGILRKLFEIANAIVDVVLLRLPDARAEDTRERVRDLLFLKKLIFGFPRVERTQRRILEDKFERVRRLGWDGGKDGPEADGVRRRGGTGVEGMVVEERGEGMVEEWDRIMGVRGLVDLL